MPVCVFVCMSEVTLRNTLQQLNFEPESLELVSAARMTGQWALGLLSLSSQRLGCGSWFPIMSSCCVANKLIMTWTICPPPIFYILRFLLWKNSGNIKQYKEENKIYPVLLRQPLLVVWIRIFSIGSNNWMLMEWHCLKGLERGALLVKKWHCWRKCVILGGLWWFEKPKPVLLLLSSFCLHIWYRILSYHVCLHASMIPTTRIIELNLWNFKSAPN